MSRGEMKKKAKERLVGNWGDESVYALIYILLYILPTMILNNSGEAGVVGLLINIAILPLAAGYIKHVMDFVAEKETSYSDLFYFYKSDELGGIIILGIYVAIFTFLWSMLFIIPGIIAAYAYAMATYIKVEEPELDSKAIVAKSKALMDGNKFDLFILGLSFFGWGILAALTFVGTIPLLVYSSTVMVIYYNQLKELNN